MRDDHHTAPEGEGFDVEIGYRPILKFIVGLFALTAVVLVLMSMLVAAFTDDVVELDPPPSPIEEARGQIEAPGPELQVFPPVADIEALYEWEEHQLGTYGWVDEQAGVARIPIERAIEIMAERGLPIAGAEEAVSAELFGEAPADAAGGESDLAAASEGGAE